ncbi:MAG TPA: emopamil-binding family protein [Chloroflexia bacterium]
MRNPLARQAIPLAKRPGDLVLIAFFAVNLVVITYMVDVEQLIIADPARFSYPLWPPPFMVDAVHWWGRSFDPLLLARPVWWKMTIAIDSLFFGPYYVAALYAFLRPRDWIWLPSLVYSGLMLANVTIILGEETWGPYRSPQLGIVFLANLPWILCPLYLIYRMRTAPHPFTEATPAGETQATLPGRRPHERDR